MVDKYTWVDMGSSYLPGELIAAFLVAQMEEAAAITAARLALWERYHAAFDHLEQAGRVRRPIVPGECRHNAHMYYLLTADLTERTALIAHLRAREIHAVFHYVPLHSSPAGRRYGRPCGELPVTGATSDRLLRLPLWVGLDQEGAQQRVIESVCDFYR
jgi:dTDP-4-amino-4,6-dideoxygalactose transaminase